MLERLLSRRACAFGASLLAGRVLFVDASFVVVAFVVVAFVLSQDCARAQAPGVFGVYKTASAFGQGGFGQGGFGAQGVTYGAAQQGFNAGSGGFGANGAMSGYGAANAQASALFAGKPVEIDEPEFVYRGHDEKEPITSLKFLSFNDGNGYAVLSASGDKTAKLWALEGKYDPETTEWFVTSARLRKTYKDVHKQGLTDAIFSPDFRFVLTSSYDQTARLWNFGNQENIRAYLGCKDRVWKIAVATSGEYVAGACNDGRVYFWESLTVKKLGSLPNRADASLLGVGYEDVGHEGPVFDVAFSPDSQFVATAGADGTVRLWNLGLQRQVAVFKGHADKVYSVRFSEDGTYLLTASRDKTARLWNATTTEEVCRFVGHQGAVRQAIFTGSYVCTSSDDGTVRLWSPQGQSGANANDPRNAGMGASMTENATGTLGTGSMGVSSTTPTTGGSMPGSAYGSMGSGSMSGASAEKSVAQPTRKQGKAKGTELAVFKANSPVFAVDVTDDSVYVCGGCADGTVKIWRFPGAARYYGDSGSSNVGGGTYGNSGSGYDSGSGSMGFGADPMADPSNTLAPTSGLR